MEPYTISLSSILKNVCNESSGGLKVNNSIEMSCMALDIENETLRLFQENGNPERIIITGSAPIWVYLIVSNILQNCSRQVTYKTDFFEISIK